MAQHSAFKTGEQVPTLVLDDEPTGTQMAAGGTVLLETSARRIAEVLSAEGSPYVQTNSRALEDPEGINVFTGDDYGYTDLAAHRMRPVLASAGVE